MTRTGTFSLSILCSALLVACGGGSGGDDATTRSVSGVVTDGYLKGATVCVDVNRNARCDSGEPVSAATGDDGAYTIADVPKADADNSPIVAVIPPSAQDSDDTVADAAATVGSGFVMMAPAGKGSVVSPLTTLVQGAMLNDPALTVGDAANEIKAKVKSLEDADLFADYIGSGAAGVHDAAKVVANSLKANHDTVKSHLEEGDDAHLAVVLSQIATKALQSQGGAPNPAAAGGAEDMNTLLATVANRKGSGKSATQDVTVPFALVNDGNPVECGTSIVLKNTRLWDHATDAPATPDTQWTAGSMVDTRFYVSNVMLWDAAGKAVPLVMSENDNQSMNVALMDFGYSTATLPDVACTTERYTAISGKVAPGTYTGISMTIGVPVYAADMATKLNHINTADTNGPKPLQNAAMAWSWQSGRKFMKLEFHPDSNTIDKIDDGTINRWNVHVGSTGCSGDPMAGNETACTNPNRISLKFDSFDPAKQKVTLDIAQLFKDADVTFDGGGAAGCMAATTDPECAPIFKALGLGPNGRNLDGADAQTVFTIQ